MLSLLLVPFAIFSVVSQVQQNATCKVPVIGVSGQGTASGTPDTATFTVQIETTSPTSLQAAQTTNTKMSQVTQILRDNGIPASDIQTSSLSISPQYNYSNGSYPYPIIGQTASTSVNVRINNISSDGTSVGRLYDQLSNIDGVSITNLAFDIRNKTTLRTRARALAYEQASSTATQFAQLGGYRLGSAQTISEQSIETPTIPIIRQQSLASFAMAAPEVATSVSTGSFQVNVNTQYTFYLL